MTSEENEDGLTGPEEYAAAAGEIGVRPDVSLLESFLDEVHKGQLRVPKFQRPFVWRPEQMLDLFDSIERGYPIGSLLLWQTNLRLESLERVGGLRVPDMPGQSATYVLDGHQRLSTLYSCLYHPDDSSDGGDATPEWVWHLYRVLGQDDSRANRYAHWKKAGPPPTNYLPVRSVLKTLDFLAFARQLAKTYDGDVYDALVEEGEQVAQRIKSYKVSVVTLLGGSLAQAVEVFSRVNSKGQPMRPDEMVSALTYKGEGEESLANSIDAILDRIESEGFGEIASTTAFRAVLAVAGEVEVTGARWDVLARRVEGRVSQAIVDTDKALSLAVDFLRDKVGVPLARLIPYSNSQLMLLTLFFHLRPHPSEQQIQDLVRWFWITSWSGQFASVNSTTSRQSIQDMRAFATESRTLAEFGSGQGSMFDFADQRARPFPGRFDLRSARVRAYLLWELREFPDRYTITGERYPATEVIRRLDRAAFRHISTKPGLVHGSDPANRLVLEANPGIAAREYMLRCLALAEQHGILGVTEEALHCFRLGDDDGFIRARTVELAARERTFMESIGAIVLPAAPADNSIDAEEP
jgi:hypothetical protein